MTEQKSSNIPAPLPIYEIKGVPFFVDVDLALLRHVKDPQNFIEFSDMEDMGTHYKIEFDVKTETADIYGDGGPGLVKIKIPPMVQLDPERVSRKYNLSIDMLPKRDSELKSHSGWFQLRKMGKQPNVEICGRNYFVNLSFGQLDPEDLRHIPIRFSELEKDPTNTYYTGLLNINTMTIVSYDENTITEIPVNTVMIMLPHERVLDPFAYRLRGMGWEDHPERLGKFPVRYEMEARIMDWNDTPIPELIKSNLAKYKISGKKRKDRGKRNKL